MADKTDQEIEAEGFSDVDDKGEAKKVVEAEVKIKDQTVEEKAAAEKAEADKVEADKKAAEEAEGDAPVVLTKKQFDKILADLEEASGLKKTVQSLTGTIGNHKQEIEGLKKTTATLEITDADFEELVKEFPEIGAGVKKGFGGVLKRLVGAAPPKGVGEDDIKKAIFNAVNAREQEILEDAEPEWKDVVGKKADAEKPFRQWLAKQAPQYQTKVTTTFSANVILRAINRFRADEKNDATKAEADRKAAEAEAAKAKVTSGRTDRLRAGVQPRGDGGSGAPGPKQDKTEDEAFATATRE